MQLKTNGQIYAAILKVAAEKKINNYKAKHIRKSRS